MWVQITEFDVPGMGRAEYDEWCLENIPAIAQFPGVVGKLFCYATDSSRAAGVYTFADRESAETYLRGELHQAAIVNNPALANIRTRGIDLLERPTGALTEALAPSPVGFVRA